MHYKKYIVRSPLFAPRDPRLSASRDPLMSEQVLAAFSGAAPKPSTVPPPPPRRAAGSR